MSDLKPLFEAIVNTPGYLPMADDATTFDSASDAWAWLADERGREEDQAEERFYSDALMLMARLGEVASVWPQDTPEWMATARVGTVYAGTPGYDGEHDLGLAYTVVRHDHLHIGDKECHACQLLSEREV